MKRIGIGILCLVCLGAHAQVLRDINYSYRYNPGIGFFLNWNVTPSGNTYTLFYDLQLADTTQKNAYSIQFELRESLSDKSGNAVTTPSSLSGSRDFQAQEKQNILVAKVKAGDGDKATVYIFYKLLPTQNSQYLVVNQRPVLNGFVHLQEPLQFLGFDQRPVTASYYSDFFPAAAPPFATAQAKVSKTIAPDSLFSIDPALATKFLKKGLYLLQTDTASTTGLAFRVEDDYPKLGRLETLAGPLLYICTKQENEKLRQAGNDKKKFDQVILSITGNAERARTFMRTYFKRVELANQYFTSYKEGWKTDRGMIYIIFGVPEEVYLFDDREVWEYKNEQTKIRFQFTKSPSLFDPDNYVLIRDKKFNTPWLDMVDLWRKARF